MLTHIQAIILGLLQGISELFPVSSLGHSVILPKLVGWNINQRDPFFLIFLVATHLATAIVLFCFFWRDWTNIIKGIFRSLAQRKIDSSDPYAKLGWLLVVGTIPAGILGLLLQEKLQAAFASARIASFFLMLNGILMLGAELLRIRNTKAAEQAREAQLAAQQAVTAQQPAANMASLTANAADARVATLSFRQAIYVGIAQTLALIPGFSRSGATIGGGLLIRLSHEDAARFAFLLATPIIAAAALLKIPELLGSGNTAMISTALLGATCSGVAAYLAVRFLMRFFHTNKLTPFAVYCFSAGFIISLYFAIRS